MQQLMPLEPECPGYDKCPIPMCGCRWLGDGLPWRRDDGEQLENSKPDENNRNAAGD